MNNKLVIFDFDGTIADTSDGILDSHRYTLQALGRKVPSDSELRDAIGGQLLSVYKDKFGLPDAIARVATRIYRNRYAAVGIHKAMLYPGIDSLLRELKTYSYKIALATLKAQRFAETMLQELGLFELFDCICGMDENDSYQKVDLLRQCMDSCDAMFNRTILIGDSNNDYLGAKQANVGFIGVTYGFGFQPNEEYSFRIVTEVCGLKEAIVEYKRM